MSFKSHPLYPNQIILTQRKYWLITLWENQYYLGRASIELREISKKHISELSEEEILELFSLISSYERALRKVFGTTNFNWACLMNNQYKEKNKNNPEALHFHVWPRYSKEVVFRNELFKDETFGHHYDRFKEKNVKKDFLIELGNTILKEYKE